MRFRTAFNEQVDEFQQVAARLSTLAADFTKVQSFEAPDAPQSNEQRERQERISQSLDRRVPHGLGEDFR